MPLSELEKAALIWYDTRQAFLDAEFKDLKYEGERRILLNSASNGEHALADAVRKFRGYS